MSAGRETDGNMMLLLTCVTGLLVSISDVVVSIVLTLELIFEVEVLFAGVFRLVVSLHDTNTTEGLQLAGTAQAAAPAETVLFTTAPLVVGQSCWRSTGKVCIISKGVKTRMC